MATISYHDQNQAATIDAESYPHGAPRALRTCSARSASRNLHALHDVRNLHPWRSYVLSWLMEMIPLACCIARLRHGFAGADSSRSVRRVSFRCDVKCFRDCVLTSSVLPTFATVGATKVCWVPKHTSCETFCGAFVMSVDSSQNHSLTCVSPQPHALSPSFCGSCRSRVLSHELDQGMLYTFASDVEATVLLDLPIVWQRASMSWRSDGGICVQQEVSWMIHSSQ